MGTPAHSDGRSTARRRARRARQSAAARLARFYRRNGYVRMQDPERIKREGPASYKKGDEVRLVAASKEELRLIRRLLRAEGFEPGRPFAKRRQYGLPIYGREAVARFLELVDAEEEV